MEYSSSENLSVEMSVESDESNFSALKNKKKPDQNQQDGSHTITEQSQGEEELETRKKRKEASERQMNDVHEMILNIMSLLVVKRTEKIALAREKAKAEIDEPKTLSKKELREH